MSPVRKLLSQASTPVIRLLRWSWLLGGTAVVGMVLTFAVLYRAHARIEAYQHPVVAEQRLERIAIVAVALELVLAVLVMDRLGRRVLTQATLAARREEQLRALVDTSPLAIIVSSVDSRVLDWNPAAERIFGYSRAEVLHQPLPIVAPDRVA
ncbi:MAG TPA: PAS domain S-box protein, partial [Gemmatimonadaceae bacterium]